MRTLALWLACCVLLAGCGDAGTTPTGPSASAATAGPRLSHTRFLAFGDSLTLGEVTSPVSDVYPDSPIFHTPNLAGRLTVVPSAAYPSQLLSQLTARYTRQATTVVVINAGKGGEHPHEGVRRFPDVFAAAQPQVVLLWEGANSLHLYGTDLPTEALAAMTIDAQTKGARVFIANLPPTRLGLRLSQPIVQLLSINTKIAALAAREGAVLVNVYDAMLPEAETLIGSDGLHPTELGYKRIADVFFAAIRADLEVN